jgi:hypothetical protein
MKLFIILTTAFLSSTSLAMEQIEAVDLSMDAGIEVAAIKTKPLKTTRLGDTYERVTQIMKVKGVNRSVAARHER